MFERWNWGSIGAVRTVGGGAAFWMLEKPFGFCFFYDSAFIGMAAGAMIKSRNSGWVFRMSKGPA